MAPGTQHRLPHSPFHLLSPSCRIFLYCKYAPGPLPITYSHVMYTIFADVTLNDTTEEGSVRLVGRANLTEGHVEIFFLGQWGTVCNYGWDLVDATVVCHQLGYLRADRSTSLGAGSGPSWYSNVRCAGTEMQLTECWKSISPLGSACSSSQKAGVVCSSESACLHFVTGNLQPSTVY